MDMKGLGSKPPTPSQSYVAASASQIPLTLSDTSQLQHVPTPPSSHDPHRTPRSLKGRASTSVAPPKGTPIPLQQPENPSLLPPYLLRLRNRGELEERRRTPRDRTHTSHEGSHTTNVPSGSSGRLKDMVVASNPWPPKKIMDAS